MEPFQQKIKMSFWKILGKLVIAAGLFHAVSAAAGPPYTTDDPEPVEYRHWEFYLASQTAHAPDGWSGTAPHVEINHGALPNLQLHLIAPLAFSAPKTGNSHYGYGDTEIGAKYRFVQETEIRPQVGEFVLIEIPTGSSDNGLGNGNWQFFLPIWLQKSFGPWLMYGGGGYWFTTKTPSQNWWFFGYLLQRQVFDKLNIGVEIFHVTHKDQVTEPETRFNIGLAYDLSILHHLMLSAGRGLQGGNIFQSYIAYQLTIGP